MKVSASKKTIAILIVLFLLLLLGGILSLKLTKKSSNPLLDELLTYCQGDKKEVRCKLFLEGEVVEVEDDERCLFARIPTVIEKGQNKKIRLCSRKDDIIWKNPYGDYESFVPVSAVIRHKKKLFTLNEYVIDKINIEILEDKEVVKLQESLTFAPGETIRPAMTKYNYRIKKNGYYFSPPPNEDESERRMLVISKAEITSYTLTEDGMMNITLNVKLNGKEFVIKSLVKSFDALKFKGSEKKTETINTGNIDTLLAKNLTCNHFFTTNDETILNEEFVEKYIEKLQGNENTEQLILKFLTCADNE